MRQAQGKLVGVCSGPEGVVKVCACRGGLRIPKRKWGRDMCAVLSFPLKLLDFSFVIKISLVLIIVSNTKRDTFISNTTNVKIETVLRTKSKFPASLLNRIRCNAPVNNQIRMHVALCSNHRQRRRCILLYLPSHAPFLCYYSKVGYGFCTGTAVA